MNEIETVACKFCGEQTQYTGTRECVNCHEVVIRLDKFLKSHEARIYTLSVLVLNTILLEEKYNIDSN